MSVGLVNLWFPSHPVSLVIEQSSHVFKSLYLTKLLFSLSTAHLYHSEAFTGACKNYWSSWSSLLSHVIQSLIRIKISTLLWLNVYSGFSFIATAPYMSCLLYVIWYNTIHELSTLCYLIQQHSGVIYFMLFATAPFRSYLLYVICYSTIRKLSILYVSFYHTVDSYLNALQYFRCRIKSKIFLFIWSRLFNLYLRINY